MLEATNDILGGEKPLDVIAKLDDRTFPVAVIFVVPESTSGVAK